MTELRIRRPEEGWLPLVLLAVMVLLVAWAIDEPAWVNSRGELTDNLPLFAMAGLAVGFAGPKLGWGRWTTHLVGAAFAALLIPVFAGWAEFPGATLSQAFTATARGTVQAYLDIAWLGKQFTNEEIHYILVFAIVVWASAQFAAYAVFGHRRPLNAIVVLGLVLVANMSLTLRDQLSYLVAFTGAALFLLIGMHAFDERATWIRRRIGDPSTISSLYLRGGTAFIVIALFGSMVLTTRAASSPLAGAWDGFDDQLIEVGDTISRIFPVGGDFRGGGGVSFGPTVRISDRWFSDDAVAFTAQIPPEETDSQRWRAAAYDTFDLTGWVQSATSGVPVAAGDPLLVDTPEAPNLSLSRELTVTVSPQDYDYPAMLSPGTPELVSRDSSVMLGSPGAWFASVDMHDIRAGYEVTARVLRLDEKDVISLARLRAASEDYPPAISQQFTAVPDGAMGPDATELLAQIRATAKSEDPLDLAVAMVAYLQDEDHFHYNPDVSGVPCDVQSKVECFARTQQGYCLHYASTMAILLRAAHPDNPIPTRLVQGFLPGERVGLTETVRNNGAHAWVEVYFPGYGWIPFDPTGGDRAQPQVIQEGVAPSFLPTPLPSGGDDRGPDPTRPVGGNAGGTITPPPGSGPADRTLLIVVTLVLALVVGGAALAAWLRGPRGEMSPDRAWFTLAKSASRLGFAPRPTQTIYEYAATLGDLVPVAKADLHTVAEAKVESSYARMRLGGDRLRAVTDATRRLRLSLFRLVLWRGPWARGRRRRR